MFCYSILRFSVHCVYRSIEFMNKWKWWIFINAPMKTENNLLYKTSNNISIWNLIKWNDAKVSQTLVFLMYYGNLNKVLVVSILTYSIELLLVAVSNISHRNSYFVWIISKRRRTIETATTKNFSQQND